MFSQGYFKHCKLKHKVSSTPVIDAQQSVQMMIPMFFLMSAPMLSRKDI